MSSILDQLGFVVFPFLSVLSNQYNSSVLWLRFTLKNLIMVLFGFPTNKETVGVR
ncbi:hypothetical protein HanRHA438_Chr11g0486871 [Helianthus annuus]|nr:hypothetical protein HanRHA438_Chr11g0486871 [Helianthus annuus]